MKSWPLLENEEALILVYSAKGPPKALPCKIDCQNYYELEKDLTNRKQEQIKLTRKIRFIYTQEKNIKDLRDSTLGVVMRTIFQKEFIEITKVIQMHSHKTQTPNTPKLLSHKDTKFRAQGLFPNCVKEKAFYLKQ